MPRGKAVSSGEDGMTLIGSVQVGGFAGIDDGQAVVKPLEVSVNKDLAGLPTRFSERVHGEEILVYKKQLPAARNEQMSAVEKRWKEVQKPFNSNSTSLPSGEREYDSPSPSNSGNSGEPSNLGVLKNFVDTIEKRVTTHDSWLKVICILVGAAIILGAVGVLR